LLYFLQINYLIIVVCDLQKDRVPRAEKSPDLHHIILLVHALSTKTSASLKFGSSLMRKMAVLPSDTSRKFQTRVKWLIVFQRISHWLLDFWVYAKSRSEVGLMKLSFTL